MTPMPPLLSVRGLRKAYGQRQAVAQVDFELRPGEVLGLLGPNGAGKSTTVGMICGLTAPDAGEVVLAGGVTLTADETGFKRRIGLVPQDLALYEDLPARQNLELFGALYGLSRAVLRERAAELLACVGLTERAGDKPATFSGGMKRRLNIAAALMHDPDLLILDEPTAGVDPQSRNAIFEHLEALKQQGKALIYTTHYMEEAERLADRIVVIDHGRVVARGTQAELLTAHATAPHLRVAFDGDVSVDDLPGVLSARRVDEGAELTLTSYDAAGPALAALTARGARLRSVNSARVTLEDVFLALTGRQLRD